MTRANIKYNHVDSKVTYLVSLSCCHEYILNEWNPSQPIWAHDISFKFELYKIISVIYMVKSLEML